MSRPEPESGQDQPPRVDHAEVDEALQQVRDLQDLPLEQHQARLSRVHEVLAGVLHPDRR
jgi:hypothetical protein